MFEFIQAQEYFGAVNVSGYADQSAASILETLMRGHSVKLGPELFGAVKPVPVFISGIILVELPQLYLSAFPGVSEKSPRKLQELDVPCLFSGKMKGRKKGHSLPSPFMLLFFCIAGHTTAELDDSKEEHVVGAAWPPLKLVHSFCAMKADDGPCKAIHIRYFFNIKSRKCEVFEYGGCHGNENNFLTLEECQEKCVAKELPQKMALAKIKKGKPDFCFHAQEPGVCRGYFTRYFYNKETKLCEAFKYGGCLGNQNNFRSLEECQTTCQDNSNLLPTVAAEEHPSSVNSSSSAEQHPNSVNSSSPAEEPSQSPGIFVNLLPAAPNEKSTTLNSSSSKEEPNQFPIFFEPPTIPSLCMTPMDRGLCRAKELRFFYNHSTGRCRPFSYSGCGGNENNFISRKSCLRICKKGMNKKKGERRLIKIKKKRKKQPVKALGMEIIPERMQL